VDSDCSPWLLLGSGESAQGNGAQNSGVLCLLDRCRHLARRCR
jgi:hypothetical protein